MSRPLISLTTVFACGLFIGRALEISPQLSQTIMAVFSTAAMITLFSRKNLFLLFAIALFFPLGLLLWNGYGEISSDPMNVANFASDTRRVIEGVVTGIEDGPDSSRLFVEDASLIQGNNRVSVKGAIQLTIASPSMDILAGDRIRFWARLKSPRNFANPGGFDYRGFMRDRGIYATAFMQGDRYAAVMGDANPFWRAIHANKKRIQEAIVAASEGDARGIVMAITLGNTAFISEKTSHAFRKTGLSHLLAISGLHMGIVAFFFYRLFLWCLSRSERILLHSVAKKGAALLTLFPLTFYLVTSGMGTSAIRAYIMAAVFLLSVIIDRDSEIFNTIALAALIILISWPQALFDPAFLLSFAAVLSIVYMTPRLEGLFFKSRHEKSTGWSKRVCAFIMVSVAASLGTAPIIIFFFNEISTVGVFSNLLIVPLLGFIAIPVASLAMFAAAAGLPGAAVLFAPVSFVASVSSRIIDAVSSLPFVSTLISPPAPFEILLYYILLLALFNIRRKWALSAAIIIPLVFLTIGTVGKIAGKEVNTLKITFLSVGQGESTFIEFPNGKNMLIDGGGVYNNSIDVGKMVVRPYLLFRGVHKIDYLVMTHPHPDHMNGLIHILKEFETGAVWMTDEKTVDDNHETFVKVVRERNINHEIIYDSSKDLIVAGVRIEFLHPPSGFDKGRDSSSKINNRSIVMRIRYGKRAFLLTGDLEVEGERRIMKKGYDIKADVLKVGHHGSLSSSSTGFIQRVSPMYGVFTVGYKNRFHFPRAEVVERVMGMGAEIYRTDLHGAITFTSDGESLIVKTFRP